MSRAHPALFMAAVLSTLAALMVPAATRDALAGPEAQLPPVTGADDRWGINHVYPDARSQQAARDAGARWNRWEFRWDEIETAAGRFDYTRSDAVVNASRSSGLTMEGILISTPAWARDQQQTQLPSGLYLPWNDSRNLWGRFVLNIATRYRGTVRYWEAWNEPDSADIFWGGTIADYYQLLKVTYLAVKSVDPTAQVLLGGLAYWTNPSFLDGLLRLMAADSTARANNSYFDVLVWHTYSRPTDVLDRVSQSRQQLASTVGARPIWINETNVPAWDESALNSFRPYQWAGTIPEQASYMIQALSYGVAAGADKVFVYRMQDTDWPEAYGLMRQDGSLRPAYTAYQVATQYFSRATAATLARQGDAEQVIIQRPGERVIVVWNRTATRMTALFGARTTTATAVDQTGATRTLRPTLGQYQLDLAPATDNNGSDSSDYIIGGTPIIIVESLPTGLQTAEDFSPLITYGGIWNAAPAPGSSGTVRRSGTAGSSATIGFDGPSVTWVTSKGPDHGIARVAVDGLVLGDVDLYSPTVVPEVPLTFGDFSSGAHRLSITVLGQRSSRATGTWVDLDSISASALRSATAIPLPTGTPTPSPSAAAGTRSRTPTVTPSTATPTAGTPGLATASAAPTVPVVSQGFTLQASPVTMSWTGGSAPAGYLIVRGSTSGVALLPSSGPLPASATSFTETSAVTSPTCYALLPLGGTPPAPLGASEVLCVLPNTRSANGAPGNVTLRLNQGTANLSWTAPGGQTGYLLVPLGGSPIQLPANATSTDHVMTGPTCYVLVATTISGILGNSDVVCGIPGVSTAGAQAQASTAPDALPRAR